MQQEILQPTSPSRIRHILLHFSFLLHPVTCKRPCVDRLVACCHHSAPLRPLSCNVLAEQVERSLLWFLLAQLPRWALPKLLSMWPAWYRRDGNEHRSPRKKMLLSVPARGSQQSLLPFPFVFLVCHFNFCVPSFKIKQKPTLVPHLLVC